MGQLFLLEIALDYLLLSQNKLTRTTVLRGFNQGIELNWINPKVISGSLSKVGTTNNYSEMNFLLYIG